MDIKDFPNYTINQQGVVTNKTTGKNLTPITKNGYFQVRLNREGKQHSKSVHILVYESFIGPRTKGMHIDHIDGVRTNNHYKNLRELSPEDNNKNRIHLSRGEQVNTSKLTAEQVMDIRKRKQNGERTLDLAKEYGVGKWTINRIAKGDSWKHLPSLGVDNTYWGNPQKTGAISGKILRKKYGDDYFARIATGQKVKKHCDTCSCV